MDGMSSVQFSAAQVSGVALSPIQPGQNRNHPAMDAAAKVLGMSAGDLRSELQSGQSLAAIASSKGIDQGTLTAAMATAIQQAHPTISADQATKVATALATRTPPAGPPPADGTATTSAAGAAQGHHHHHHHGGGAAMDAAAQTVGMSANDLTTALKNGQSLSQIASSKGVSQDDLVKAMASALTQSNPNLSTDQATQLATQMVTQKSGSQNQVWNAGTQQAAATFSITA